MDYPVSLLAELRISCATAGQRVRTSTESGRDAMFRAAVATALQMAQDSTSGLIAGCTPAQFVCGLSADLGAPVGVPLYHNVAGKVGIATAVASLLGLSGVLLQCKAGSGAVAFSPPRLVFRYQGSAAARKIRLGRQPCSKLTAACCRCSPREGGERGPLAGGCAGPQPHHRRLCWITLKGQHLQPRLAAWVRFDVVNERLPVELFVTI